MRNDCPVSKLQRATVVVGALFGVLSLVAGGRVLLGLSSPGHVVLMPLLVFNVLMGAVYVAVALRIRADAARGRSAAAWVVAANAVVLGSILAYAGIGGIVATDSLVAMTLRTGVWAGIWGALGFVVPSPAAAGARRSA